MSELRLPSAAFLSRYPADLPWLVYLAPLAPWVAGGLDLTPLYTADRPGARTNLYFIQADAPNGPIKIGVASRPEQRLEQLQIGCPSPLRLIVQVPGTVAIERAIHRHLKEYRRVGEWFEPATPVLELVSEFFEISLMLEDYAMDGCELAFDDLAAIMADQVVA